MKKILFLIIVAFAFGEANATQVTKILAIGNSFSEDAIEQNLHEIADADGFRTIIGNLYIPGCSLERDMECANGNLPAFRYRKIGVDGKMVQTDNEQLEKALLDEQWDYVSVQQASHFSGMYDTYQPYIKELISYVKKHIPSHTKIIFHQTWAYSKDSNHEAFIRYEKNQIKMYESIVACTQKVMMDCHPDVLVPAGTAIQNARTSFLGDRLNRDGYHLNLTYGRYTAACTWYQAIFGKSVLGNSYKPLTMSNAERLVAQQSADAAVKNPYGVTYFPKADIVGDGCFRRGEGMFEFQDSVFPMVKPLEVHYYIPDNVDVKKCPIIFIFQGNDRNYTYLIDAWGQVAKDRKFIAIVPQFPMQDFPLYLYQEVGIMNKEHTELMPQEKTTASMIDRLFLYVKKHIASRRNDYKMYGHSAGGQFVQRFMMMHDSPYVSRAVVGSPGWYTFPDRNMDYSYGIKNVPYVTDKILKRWMSKDIIIQTASLDTLREWFLRTTPEADAQGKNRLERGKNFFNYCHKLAVKKHWTFNWREQTIKGIGHESVPMGMAAVDILLKP